jgi:hypothetical protein
MAAFFSLNLSAPGFVVRRNVTASELHSPLCAGREMGSRIHAFVHTAAETTADSKKRASIKEAEGI